MGRLVWRTPSQYQRQVRNLLRSWQRQRYWRLTLRSAPLLEAALLNRWHQEIRLFRWKILARTAARRHLRQTPGIVTEFILEPYQTGENVVKLSSRRYK